MTVGRQTTAIRVIRILRDVWNGGSTVGRRDRLEREPSLVDGRRKQERRHTMGDKGGKKDKNKSDKQKKNKDTKKAQKKQDKQQKKTP